MATVIGVVVIGRNEGQRLERCLCSLAHGADKVMYVDSGSTDGSLQLAANLGVDVLAPTRYIVLINQVGATSRRRLSLW